MPYGRKPNTGGLSEVQEEASILPHTQGPVLKDVVFFWLFILYIVYREYRMKFIDEKLKTKEFTIAFFMNVCHCLMFVFLPFLTKK